MMTQRASLSMTIVLCTLLVTLCASVASATTYYVATTGADNASCGAVGSPCRTIEYTYEKAALVAGDTILVQPGTYTGGGTHPGYGRARLAKQGTAGSPITIKSVTRGGAILNGGNDAAYPFYFYLELAEYNIIDGFVITNTYNHCISTWAGQSNRFINNEFTNCGTGVAANGIFEDPDSNGNYIGNNYIHHNNSSHGLYLCGDNTVVVNNIIAHNFKWGIQISGNSGIATNMKIYNNTFVSNTRSGIVIYLANANHEIKNNIFYQNVDAGVNFFDAHGSGVVIDNNISYGNGAGNLTYEAGSTITYTATNWNPNNPLFVSPSTYDFHLQASSPAINAGLNTAPTVTADFDGNARAQGSAYDIGAYEANPPRILRGVCCCW